MATAVEMPKPGNTVEECLVTRWHKQKGDRVAEGEVLADIETDKATFEVAAPASGTVLEVFFGEGSLVPVFTNLCVIGEPGESVETFRPQQAAPAVESDRAIRTVEAAPAAVRAAAPPPPAGAFSPRARRFAAEHDFHPAAVAGSGPGGRVLEEDLRRLYHASPRVSALARKQMESGWESRGDGSGIGGMILAADLAPPAVRVSGIRERIARRMRESLATTAQYTLHASANAAGLLALRARVKASPGTTDININELVVFCTVQALLRMPALNAEFIDGKIVQHPEVNIGFACDTDRGLLVPVVKGCEKLGVAELALRIKDLAARATGGAISPDDLAGATFTVSNLGSLGIESFTPILNPPQVAVLGVDAILLQPVRRDGKVDFIDSIGLSLTCDHQVIDGAPGARFLKIRKEQIENVESLCTI